MDFKRSPSRQCFSAAPWVVSKRIKRSRAGYRMEQALRIIKERLEAGLPPPSLDLLCELTGIDGKGNASAVISRLEERGEIIRGPNRKIALP